MQITPKQKKQIGSIVAFVILLILYVLQEMTDEGDVPPSRGNGRVAEPIERTHTGGVLDLGQTRVVRTVVDGDTVTLTTGQDVRMIGLQAPKLPLGRTGFPTWPMAPEAKAYLEELADGKTVTLAFGGAERDRHGRLLAHLYRVDGLWLQGAMVDAGLARVYSFPDNRSCVRVLQAKEERARKARKGLWALPYYKVRGVDELGGDIDSYQLIEGVVRSTADVRGRIYLNFSDDWDTDFTATISERDRRVFPANGDDLLRLEGERIRLRGWISEFNGPNLEVTHPEQIEYPERDPLADADCSFDALIDDE